MYEAATVNALEIFYNLCVLSAARAAIYLERTQIAGFLNSFSDEAVAWEANHPTKMMAELRQRCGVPRPEPKSALSPPYCYGVLAHVANAVATSTASSETVGAASCRDETITVEPKPATAQGLSLIHI